MGMAAPNNSGAVVPKSAAQSLICGSIAGGTRMRSSRYIDQRFLLMS